MVFLLKNIMLRWWLPKPQKCIVKLKICCVLCVINVVYKLMLLLSSLTVDDRVLEFIGFDWTGYGQNPNVPQQVADTPWCPSAGNGSGFYWSGDDYVAYGQNRTSTMANYFEDTGFGDPLAAE